MPSAIRATEVVATVADRLRSLSADPAGDPLEVIRLRGGIASRRPADPSRPAVLLSTLPTYGSRLLFRGYGSSRSMRPIDAALAGTDSLVLLDEAHLAPPSAGFAARPSGMPSRRPGPARGSSLAAPGRGPDRDRRCGRLPVRSGRGR